MGVDGHQLLYTAAAVLLAVLLFTTLRTPVIRRNGMPLRKPPNTLPLAGNGILFLQARRKLFAWFVKCQRQFGYETFQVAVPTLPPGVVINDPRILDFVFKSEGALISKGSFVKGMLWDLFGHGIVNADGDIWRVQRKAGLAFLNTANIRILTDIALPKHLAEILVLLGTSADTKDKEVDLQAVFHELTSCIMGKMAYNMEMHADDDFTMAFDFASEKTTERFQNPLWPVTETVSGLFSRVGGAAELRRSLAIVKAFGRRIVSTAVADKQTHHGHPGSIGKDKERTSADKVEEVSGSLIHSLLESISDQDVVADAALNYLSAGRDTVAQALTWTFYMLMKNPRIVDKIRREVQQVLDKQGDGSQDIVPHLARLAPAAMPYTMATFYEGLRLFPPIPFEIKQVEADLLVLPDGTELVKGSLVIWCSWALNRSKETWGDDADEFRPERWLTESTDPAATSARLTSRSPSEFPVFHGGPRACLGKKMAESMAIQSMAAVAWSFDFRLVNPDEERVTRTSLTLPMEGGLPCYVQSRAFS
ncbi:cytochrome p450 [Ophiostoma piceae UAMH 11346]|uniref:Cytochrome p450 n=1 Tax=Ophiostoma piceae (strain UAMH 11346) TaxID=1262450 RepID=S3CF89_OPHP1|nr:cytochrome p450 [Ophiostoma piceae UAMH 11346]